jgi:HEAT repeat protein
MADECFGEEAFDENTPRIEEMLNFLNSSAAQEQRIREILPGLGEQLTSAKPEEREGAAMALGNIGPPAKMHVPRLLQCLKDSAPLVRVLSAYALAKITPPCERALRCLTKELQHNRERSIREEAADALAEVGGGSALAVRALCRALRDRDEGVRYRSAYALFRIGEAARRATRALIACLQDPSTEVRGQAAVALAAVGNKTEAVVRALLPLLNDEDDDVRSQVAHVIWECGPPAVIAVPALLKALEDPNEDVRRWATFSLAHIGPPAAGATPTMAEFLKDEHLCRHAAHALKGIGTPEAIEILRNAIDDAPEGLKETIRKVLAAPPEAGPAYDE